MKKEISPAIIGIALAFVVAVLAAAFYREVIYTPPSAHPKLFGGPRMGTSGLSTPAGQPPAGR